MALQHGFITAFTAFAPPQSTTPQEPFIGHFLCRNVLRVNLDAFSIIPLRSLLFIRDQIIIEIQTY